MAKRLVKLVRFTMAGLLGPWLLAFAGLYAFQRSFIFHPDTRPLTPNEAGLAGFDVVAITPQLKSWWHPSNDPKAPVILYFHGNGGAIASRAGIFADMAEWGAGVLAVGYPGYGGNPGSPSEEGIHAAAQANYDWLIKQGVDPARIVITAHSMGTGVAVPLAAKNRAAGLIIESPFTSLASVAQRTMAIFPLKWLVKDPFRSTDMIERVRMPVVWMHGTADQLIPYAMGEALFASVHAPKCFLRIEGGDHDHLWGAGVSAYTRRQAFAMVRTGTCDGRPVRLEKGQLLPG